MKLLLVVLAVLILILCIIVAMGYNGGFDMMSDLPPEIRDRLELNVVARGPTHTKFLDSFEENKTMAELDRKAKAGCIKDPDLYALGTKDVVDGFNVLRFAPGMYLYKAFDGFVTEKHIRDYCQKNLNYPSWFGNKYVCYVLISTRWGCSWAFKIIKELVLIDGYDTDNLDKLYAMLSPTPRQQFKLLHGYGVKVEEQMRVKFDASPFRSVYAYDRPFTGSHYYCDTYDPGFASIGNSPFSYKIFLEVFDTILSKYPGIDGFCRRQIRSLTDYNGILFEEAILKCGSILSKMKLDKTHDLSWPSWKLKNLKVPETGLYVQGFASNMIGFRHLSPNTDFALVRFYFDNASDPGMSIKQIPNMSNVNSIMTYNIHMGQSINSEIKNIDNVANIIKMIKMSGVRTVVLQEVVGGHLQNISTKAKKLGFKTITTTLNGTEGEALQHKTANILVMSKDSFKHELVDSAKDDKYELEEYTKRTVKRNQIIIKLAGLWIACVHMEIGIRNTSEGPEINNRINQYNSAMRIRHLGRILNGAHEPDVLIGDFNFTQHDPEVKWLSEQGYTLLPTSDDPDRLIKTTPYNRVDWCFIRSGLAEDKKQYIIRCNFSDHLPVIQVL